MVTACSVTALFDALARFHGEHPGVTITLAEDDSASLTERVRSGAADLALIGAAGRPPQDLDALPVVSEGLVAAMPPGHFLRSGGQRIGLADLAGWPVVCMPAGTGIRAVLDQACAARGLRLDIALEASAPGTVADLARRGLGVAVLSQSMAAVLSAGLVVLPLDDIALPAVLALIWRPGPGPALAELLRHCRESFTTVAPAPAVG
jgi:DNA-binding transcriptional LysR family regulator